MKKEIPIRFAKALMRAGKDFDFAPLHRRKHAPRDPAARLHANKRFRWFLEKTL
jgi:dipeptidyl aminopeptidase/acylaminoacyl peptidase